MYREWSGQAASVSSEGLYSPSAGIRLGRFRTALLLSMVGRMAMLLSMVGLTACDSSSEAPKVTDKIYIEDAELERSEGKYLHEFTLVNGNSLPLTTVTVRFTYRNIDGEVKGTYETKLLQRLEAHDATRKINVDGGPLLIGGDKVKYEVVAARTTLNRRKGY